MSSRVLPTSGGLFRLVLSVAVVLAVVAGAASIPGAIGDAVKDVLSKVNPFDEKRVDHTGPSVLHSLTALSEFKAANGYYETVVDLKDDSHLPDWIRGKRLLYVGKGDVAALVDFSELDARRVIVSPDHTSVSVRLPAPTISDPVLNLKTSYVAYSDEGIIDKFEGSDLEHEAQLKAIKQMTTAAAGEGKLTDLAKDSTTTMLRGLFGSLGYSTITITFDA